MPPAGPERRSRANAHMKAARRYASEGGEDNAKKAMAHFGRALDYGASQRFGAPDDVEARIEVSGNATWVPATRAQKSAFSRASDQMAHDGQAVSGMPSLIPQEHAEGAVYQDKSEPSILWYVGKTGHMTPLRRKVPEPTEPWIFTEKDRYTMHGWKP